MTKNTEWMINFDVLTVSGSSGTGKTTVTGEIARRLDIDTVVFVGQNFRNKMHGESEQPIIGYAERDIEVDARLDACQVDLIRNARRSKPLIIEGRLAGVIAKEEKSKHKMKGGEEEFSLTASLLLWSNDERFTRIARREKLDYGTVKQLTLERERKDRERWSKLHPQLKESDPFNPKIIFDGFSVYDVVVDTSNMNVDDVIQKSLEGLEEKGFIGKTK